VIGFDAGVYNWLKLVHVMAAVVWVGSGIFVQVHATRLRLGGDAARLASFARDLEVYGKRLFAPASLTVLLFGIFMVLYSPGIGFGTTWVLLGLIGFGMTFITGAFFLGPTSGKLGRLFESRPPEDPEIQAGIRRIFAISRIDQVVLILVIVDMVLRPGS
jgi:uncharacterized membrane protein